MAKILTTDTFIDFDVNSNEPPRLQVQKSMSFTLDVLPSQAKPNALVTPWAGREMIKAKFKNDWDDTSKQDQPIAVEFDKQMLMLILSQNGCEGIRLSFCEFENKTTLVAFGISSRGTLIGEDMFKEGFILGAGLFPPVCAEQGHSVTLKQFKETIKEKYLGEAQVDLNKIADDYFDANYGR